MRIAIINLTGGGMSGGYRAYLRNMLPQLATHRDVEAILCAAPAALQIEQWFPQLPKVTFIHCAPFHFLHHSPDAGLRHAVEKFAPDVIFIPVERYLFFPHIPVVNMLQNMGPLAPVAGNPLSERLRYVAQRYETRLALKYANHVIVPTNFVRDFLIKQWHIPAQKITTIYYGAEIPKESVAQHKPAAVPAEWRGRFIFTAGSIEPYRGLEDILGAMVHLSNDRIVGLIIAGEARSNMVRYKKKLQKWIERNRLINKVRWVGTLSEPEMAWCYQNCLAFVMTSRVESFGMIGMEALAHGCVCIVANNSPLPEIFADAARYYTLRDTNGLAQTIAEVLQWDDARRRNISDRARERAAILPWDNTGAKTIEALIAASTRLNS